MLEVGTGSGYQAAVLGEIVREVYSIEIIETLAREAIIILLILGCLAIWGTDMVVAIWQLIGSFL